MMLPTATTSASTGVGAWAESAAKLPAAPAARALTAAAASPAMASLTHASMTALSALAEAECTAGAEPPKNETSTSVTRGRRLPIAALPPAPLLASRVIAAHSVLAYSTAESTSTALG
jgi:hypothetical protein